MGGLRRNVTAIVAAFVVVAAAGGCGSGGDGAETQATAAPRPDQVTTSVAPPPTTTTTVPAGPVRYSSPHGPVDTPAELARVLSDAEAVIRDGSRPLAERAEAGHRQQVAYRQLAATPEWDAEVFEALDPQWEEVARANVTAGRELRGLFPRGFPDTLPAWTIVDPAPPDELVGHYKEAEATFGVDWTLLAAINLVETRMGRIRGTSTAGAQGPMQFIPSSWELFGAGGDINDNRDAIMAAARHLVSSGGDPLDVDRALYGYNNSDHYVAAVRAYADVMRADEEAYVGYHSWQVYYTTEIGEFFLPVGYAEPERIPAATYAERPIVAG